MEKKRIGNADLQLEIDLLGARIHSLKVKGVDIVLGFDDDQEYRRSHTYCGACIGRVANRIAKGRFSLNGKDYSVNLNEGNNHLHGGMEGFDFKLFEVVEQKEDSLTLSYFSPDGEEGYPGNLTFTVKYSLKGNDLLIEFEAISDQDTLWNPTNHTYFNLDGEADGDASGNLLQIDSDRITLVDEELIPTGEILNVGGTVFDFREIKAIKTDFSDPVLQPTNGYDHNFILNSSHAAHVEGKKTGIKMDVFTDMPCLQLYTGGAIKPCQGKSVVYRTWSGFCLEPQFCPNAINLSGFEEPILKANEKKRHYIRFSF